MSISKDEAVKYRPAALKVLDLSEAVTTRREYSAKGLRVGFTNGCFDILHIGHLHSLEEARLHSDVLFVGVNSDSSVRRLKGPTRPIVCAEHRARLLAAMECVDHVVIFEEDTPLAVIEALLPDVLVKGPPHSAESLVGADIVKKRGGNVIINGAPDAISTTEIVQRCCLEL